MLIYFLKFSVYKTFERCVVYNSNMVVRTQSKSEMQWFAVWSQTYTRAQTHPLSMFASNPIQSNPKMYMLARLCVVLIFFMHLSIDSLDRCGTECGYTHRSRATPMHVLSLLLWSNTVAWKWFRRSWAHTSAQRISIIFRWITLHYEELFACVSV